MLTGQTYSGNHSFEDARRSLARMGDIEAVRVAIAILDYVVATKPASMVLCEASEVADADLQSTLAGLCLLSQGQYPIFDARLVYEDDMGGKHVLSTTPARGIPFKDPRTGAVVDDPESRMTFRFDVLRSLMERAA